MKEKIAGISVIVNLILAASKIAVGITINSAAVLAEGFHSGADIFSSAICYFGIKAGKKPVDKEHPYGHYKFEVLTGLAITLILFGAGVGIVYNASQTFFSPSKTQISYLSIGVMIFSAVINEAMARIKIHYGKEENSISLISDGVHSRIDVYISIMVLAGLLLTNYWSYADPALAVLIGAYIIKQSFSLGKNATDSLLDVSAGEKTEEKIKAIAKERGIELYDLKTQKKGSVITANLEIALPNELKMKEATEISNGLRETLMKNVENLVYVAIQIKSHDVSTSFYKPRFGSGFNWQKKGRFKEEIENAKGLGPGGSCVCLKCGYDAKHEKSVPCAFMKCPKCGVALTRK